MLSESEANYSNAVNYPVPVSEYLRHSGEWALYTDYIGKLLDCRPQYFDRSLLGSRLHAVLFPNGVHTDPAASGPGAENASLAQASSSLVIHNDRQPRSWPVKAARRMTSRRLIDRASGSVLFARHPRWPLRRILLVVRLDDSDRAALSWVRRLAVPVWTSVTILPVAPPFPRLYQRRVPSLASVEALMGPESEPGRRLQENAAELRRGHLQGDIHCHAGSPIDQVRREVTAHGYDLILMADEPSGRMHRWLMGELVGPLLSWVDRPVLVAKS